MNKLLLKASIASAAILAMLAIGNVVLADTVTGNLSTGLGGTVGNDNNNVNGVVISPPIASPAAGMYDSAQSVTLAADGATSIYYTTDGTNPTCSTGNLYSGAIAVSSSEPIEAISCYSSNASSTVAVYLYGIDPTTTSGSPSYAVSGGGGGSTPSGGSSGSSGGSSANTVGISDFVLLMANWGQTGSGNAADFNNDGVVGIQDFIWLMANWTV